MVLQKQSSYKRGHTRVTLAPYLLVTAMDYVMTTAFRSKDFGALRTDPRKSRRFAAEMLTDVDFADDLALTTNTIQQKRQINWIVSKSEQDEIYWN